MRDVHMQESDDDGGELIFAALRLEPMRQTSMPVAPCMEGALVTAASGVT